MSPSAAAAAGAAAWESAHYASDFRPEVCTYSTSPVTVRSLVGTALIGSLAGTRAPRGLIGIYTYTYPRNLYTIG